MAELDASGAVLRRFIPDGTGAMDRRVAQVSSTGAVSWFHTDHQGSVIAVTDASGHATDTASYSPYGEFATSGQLPPGGVFGYTGRQFDAETGHYQYRARYYHPRLGQFLSTDPIGTKDDPNLTLYVGVDPVNHTDPTGECEVAIGSTPRPSIFERMGGGGCRVYALRHYEPSRTPVPGANWLSVASRIGREGQTGTVFYDVLHVARAPQHWRQIRDGALGAPVLGSALQEAFRQARANPDQVITGVRANTVLPINGAQGAGLGRMQVSWEGRLWFDSRTRTYQYDAIGVANSQRFSTDLDGNNPEQNRAIEIWARVMCPNCSSYRQEPNADMRARFEFQETNRR